MDMEKINADAARFSAKWAVDKQIDAERTERQAQEEAEWQAKPFYEKVYDKAPEVVDNIKEWGTAAWNSVGAVAQDVSDAYNEYGENRLKFMHEGANLQQAYQEAAESGDYSGLNKAVDNLRQAGRDYSVSIANFAVSPARQAARSFIRSNADDNSSPWQPLAQYLEKSDVAQEYFTTDAEKLQKAREIQAATGIPAEAALANNEAYKTALDVYYLKQKSDDIENVWEEYPELKNIASMDKDAAAIALHDIQSVRQSHGIVDNFMTFLEQGKKELEYNNLQYEILNGRATEEQKKRAEWLKKEIDRDKRQAPSMFDSPLEAAAAGVGQSLPEMVQGVKEAGAIDIGLTTLAVAATVLSGGTDLLAAGAVAGIRAAIMRTLAKEGTKNLLKAGTYYGMIHGMAAPESGSRYAQMGEEKKKDGTPLYTDAERANYALLGGYINAALEIVPTLGVAKSAMFPVAERVFAQSAEQIVKRATQKETMQDFAIARLGDWFKLTATESAEEATQSIADDLITNYARESKGEEASHLKQYSAREILNRAAVNFLESLPASAAFATAGVGVGTVTGAGRISRARKRAAQMENIYGQQQAQTMMGAMMVEQLQKSVKESKMQKVAPDVQNKVLREQLKGTGYENAYIDVEMAMQKDNGREDLKKVAEAQGMSAEDLETAITSKGYISVPTETLSQVETSPDLLDSVSFTPEAESMARMRENGKKIIDEYNKNMQKAVDRQLKLAETIVDNYIPAENDEQHKAQREALKAVMLQNLQNPAQGWNELYKLYNAELQEKIGPALEALKRGMGNSGLLELPDEQGNIQTRRYTENDEWYRNWMKVHKNHKPTKAELEDMAIAMTIGDPSAPKVAGWIVDSAETQQAMERDKPVIENLKKNIDTLNSIKAEAKKMTGVEVELTEGLSPEAFKVYRAIAGWAEKAGGKIARAGRMTALLWARHADIVADIRTKKNGKKVTAEDYIRQRLLLQLEPDNGQAGEGLKQLYTITGEEMPLDQLFQRAWHGSPYDFEKFDLGAIGSGEGAQAHGWGLYFAANRKISENYKKRLSPTEEKVFIDGEEIKRKIHYKDKIIEAIMVASRFSKDVSQIRKIIEKAKGIEPDIAKQAIKYIDEGRVKIERRETGKLFQVEIPDNDVLLDEQKPLKFQPEKVQKAIRDILKNEKRKELYSYKEENGEYVLYKGGREIDRYDDEDEVIQAVEENNEEVEYQVEKAFSDIDNKWGRTIYKGLSEMLGGDNEASELLNKYGVKGITYDGDIDGRCFVVFDDKAVDIIEKYNQQVNAKQGKTLGWIDVKPNEDGQRTIHILETANESTFMHEMAHMFLFDLEELAEIDDISKKELDIVNKWTEWKKGAAKEYKGTDWYKNFAQLEQEIIDAEENHDHETAKKKKAEWRQERFARGFELYMKEGTAPARGLKGVFRKFKSFLRAIYKNFTSDGGKPTEAVRRVMDRMIATDEEIKVAALEDRYQDITKAGGEKLFNEQYEETLKRWQEEERAAAEEKVMKLVMKDFEKKKIKEFKKKLEKERERYTKDLRQENIFLARMMLQETKDKGSVKLWFASWEEFEALNKVTPSMESLIEEHMREFGEQLDKSMMEQHLTKDEIDKAMQESKWRAKIETYTLRGMERKKELLNTFNSKAQEAIDAIEGKLKNLPEDADFKTEKHSPIIKEIMKEITKLRFADKWDAEAINHIEFMLRANTQDDVRKAIKNLKERQRKKKQNVEDVESATKGMEKFYQEMVKDITAKKPMSETCNVNYYLDKERNAARRVKAMIRAKNWDGAINQQKNKVFYSMMVKQARENKETRDKMVKDLQRKLNAKTVRLPKDERYWFNHLLYIMRIARADVKVPEGGVAKLEDIFTEQKESLDIFYTPETLIRLRDEGDNFGDYNKLSLTEFRETYEDLKRLYTVGRDKFNLKTIRGVSIEEAVTEIMNDPTVNNNIATVMRKINPDTGGLNYVDALGRLGEPGDKLAKGLQQYVNSGLQVENILKMMGDKAYRYFYSTLERAAEREAELTDRNLKALRIICDMYTHEERQAWSDKKYKFSTEKGEKISKENIFAMALNWGTETNRQRLCGGLIEDGKLVGEKSAEQVGKEIEELFRKTMKEKDWQFIQHLWDLVGSYWHATAEVEEKLNGVALGRVENLPFEIETADGKKIKLNGGYMHIKYNFEKSARAEEMEMEDMLNSMQAGAKRFGAGRGMTKSRSEYNIYRTLQLDFSVIEQHLQDVIHNIAFRVPLRDVYRLLHYKNNKTGASLEEHLRRTLGVAAYREIDNWALDAWKTISDERNTASGVLQNLCRMWRSSSVFSIMAYRIWPVIENLSNVAVVADQLGAIGTMKAVGAFYRTPMEAKENLDFVRSMSAFMRTRMENIDRDLRNQPGTLHAGNKYIDLVKEHGYDLMVWSDLMCSAPTWLKSYKDAFQPKIEEVKKENDANMNKRLELASKVDDLRAAIAAEEQAAAGIDDNLHTRRYGKPEEIEALRGGEYAGLSDGEMRAQWGEHKKKARELGKELFKAEQDLEQALQLPVYDDAEMLEEAKCRAVYAADSAIRNTFGSARNIDLPAVQRSKNELVRLFTAFYGFFNTQYNALYMSYMKSKYSDKSAITKWAPFARTAFYRVAMASFIGSVLAFGLGLQGDSKDEKEKNVTGPDGKKTKVEIPALERFLKVWAKNALSIGTGGLYGVRDIAQVIGDMYLTGNNFGFKMGSVATRSITEGIKAIQLFSRKDDKDEEIKAQQEKKEREHQEKLKKYKGKKRREYLQKWEEEQKYKKPPKRITYPEIAGHAAKSAGGVIGAKFGVTATMTNAITSTMDYLLDKDMRYDPTFKNIIWSALFDKKPVEREIPKKPPAEPKKSKKKKKEKN